MKKVSIIIPVFNTNPSYVDECLESCFRQGLADDEFEIILIDDGSSSPPEDVYKKWCTAKQNIVLLRQKNSGLSATRNRGIEVASAEYLCFVDSDDSLNDNVLAPAFVAAKRDDLDVAYYHGYRRDLASTQEVCDGKTFFAEHDFNPAAWSFLVKAKFLKKSGIRFYVGKICEEAVFSYEMVSAAKRVGIVSEGGYCYRYSEDSILRARDPIRKMKTARGFLFAAEFFNSALKRLSEDPRERERERERSIICRL
ncbi:MAG: glycosyltransferase [Opitutae bacterium]|nr:glycosyltransferase [Opitutae bacterium]